MMALICWGDDFIGSVKEKESGPSERGKDQNPKKFPPLIDFILNRILSLLFFFLYFCSNNVSWKAILFSLH